MHTKQAHHAKLIQYYIQLVLLQLRGCMIEAMNSFFELLLALLSLIAPDGVAWTRVAVSQALKDNIIPAMKDEVINALHTTVVAELRKMPMALMDKARLDHVRIC